MAVCVRVLLLITHSLLLFLTSFRLCSSFVLECVSVNVLAVFHSDAAELFSSIRKLHGWAQALFCIGSSVRQIACTGTRHTPAVCVWGLRCQLLLLSLCRHTHFVLSDTFAAPDCCTVEARPFQKAFAAVVPSSAGTARQTTSYWWRITKLHEASGTLAAECVDGSGALTLKAFKVGMNKRAVAFIGNLGCSSLCSSSRGDGGGLSCRAQIYTSLFSH